MSYNNQVLLEVISQCAPPRPTTPPPPPFLQPQKKTFLPPLVWPKIEYTRSLN